MSVFTIFDDIIKVMSTCCDQTDFGLVPVSLKWNVVRGDTAELLVEFLENDETTSVDMSNWDFTSTAYDIKGDILDELIVEVTDSGVKITAPSDVTTYWGAGYGAVVSELLFDLQATSNSKTWTPVVGTIRVIGDISGGL